MGSTPTPTTKFGEYNGSYRYMRKCPVCEEGDLVEKSSRRICHGIEVTELYSVCTVCKSEICNSDQTNKNHQVAKDAGCYETETFKKFKYGE